MAGHPSAQPSGIFFEAALKDFPFSFDVRKIRFWGLLPAGEKQGTLSVPANEWGKAYRSIGPGRMN